MEIIDFEGWPNCIRLFNREIELIVTTDIGPRILRCGFINGQNLLYVSEDDKGRTGGSQWRIYGGHRLWHAPEAMPRSYFPDNNPVECKWNEKTLKLIQAIEDTTGIIKEIEITVDPDKNLVTLLHRLVNKNLWAVETSPWAITAFAAGGKAIIPQEPYVDPADNLLPARPIVLWHYTHMNDPRWIWGSRYIQLKQDRSVRTEQKIGILNKQGWNAYCLNNDVLIKQFDYNNEAQYTDYGCNNEVYVNGQFLEIESLAPVRKLLPDHCAEHTEHWYIANTENNFESGDETSIDRILIPLVKTCLNNFFL